MTWLCWYDGSISRYTTLQNYSATCYWKSWKNTSLRICGVLLWLCLPRTSTEHWNPWLCSVSCWHGMATCSQAVCSGNTTHVLRISTSNCRVTANSIAFSEPLLIVCGAGNHMSPGQICRAWPRRITSSISATSQSHGVFKIFSANGVLVLNRQITIT